MSSNGADIVVALGSKLAYLKESYSSPQISLVSPSNGTGIDYPKVMLKWNASDADEDVMSFKVYLGTDQSPGLITSGLTSQYYEARVSLDTNYYWRVVVSDGTSEVSSAIYNFTTPDQLGPVWSDQPSSSQNPTSVAMSDDGSVIAMTSGNEKLYVYDYSSLTP